MPLFWQTGFCDTFLHYVHGFRKSSDLAPSLSTVTALNKDSLIKGTVFNDKPLKAKNAPNPLI